MIPVQFKEVPPLDVAIPLSKLEAEVLALLRDGQPRTTRYIHNELRQRRNLLGRIFLTLGKTHHACYRLWSTHKRIATYNNSLLFNIPERAWVRLSGPARGL